MNAFSSSEPGGSSAMRGAARATLLAPLTAAFVVALVERGEAPRVLTREPAKDGIDGVVYVEGALGEGDALRAALERVEAVLLITPLHPQEADIGVAAVGAM